MVVIQLDMKVYLMKDINQEEQSEKLGEFIDGCLSKNKKFLELHKTNCFKNYCFNGLYPMETEKVYKEDGVYTFQIRTIDKELAEFLAKNLANTSNSYFKGLKIEMKIIRKKHIDKIFSITPLVLKNEEGYWKGLLTFDEFEERVKINLIKKYREYTGENLKDDVQLFTSVQFKNHKPVSVKYKDIKLLGDKVEFNVCDDEYSQKLAYMALGTGLGENNARGTGFVNFRYL